MTILTQIVAAKRQEIERAKAAVPLATLEAQFTRLSPPRDFLAALRDPPGVRIIAEVKRASPSAGAIRADADVVAVARAYEQHGAACVSVLTDGPFFGGSLGDLRAVRAAVSLPLLRKDFLLDRYQVLEARAAGADAVLLIAEILDDDMLAELLAAAHDLGMTALVECYEPANVPRVVASGARLIGINNRNLHTFATDLDHTRRLAPLVPADRVLVSESGIRTRADVERLTAAGVKAILVGETLMRSGDVGGTMRELIGGGQAEALTPSERRRR
jgi:indole-3-glycerol phosphate synthase